MPNIKLELYEPYTAAAIDYSDEIIMAHAEAQLVVYTEILGTNLDDEARQLSKFASNAEAVRLSEYGMIRHLGAVTLLPKLAERNAQPDLNAEFVRSRDSMLWISRYDYEGLDRFGNQLVATYLRVQTPGIDNRPGADLRIMEMSKKDDTSENPTMKLHTCNAYSMGQIEEITEHMDEILQEEIAILESVKASAPQPPKLFLIKGGK